MKSRNQGPLEAFFTHNMARVIIVAIANPNRGSGLQSCHIAPRDRIRGVEPGFASGDAGSSHATNDWLGWTIEPMIDD